MRRQREVDLHRLADDARIGRDAVADRLGRVRSEHLYQRRIDNPGQIGLEATLGEDGEVATRRRSGLDDLRIDIDVELETLAPVMLDHEPPVLEAIEPCDLGPVQRIHLFWYYALIELVVGI